MMLVWSLVACRATGGSFSEDQLSYIDDAETEVPNHPMFMNSSISSLSIPKNPLVGVHYASAETFKLPEDAAVQDKLIWCVAAEGLTYYNGKEITGWRNRPKVRWTVLNRTWRKHYLSYHI
jgi:hypothetical protein